MGGQDGFALLPLLRWRLVSPYRLSQKHDVSNQVSICDMWGLRKQWPEKERRTSHPSHSLLPEILAQDMTTRWQGHTQRSLGPALVDLCAVRVPQGVSPSRSGGGVTCLGDVAQQLGGESLGLWFQRAPDVCRFISSVASRCWAQFCGVYRAERLCG